MESVENPFTANGILSQKADYIITHSTITRTEIHIADPDAIQPEVDHDEIRQESDIKAESSPSTAAGKETNNDLTWDEVVPVETKQAESVPLMVENSVTPASKSPGQRPKADVKAETIEAEVRRVDAAEPQHAEEVRLKKKKKCCSVL